MKPPPLPSAVFTATGGARIGWTNATWPLAKLSVTPERLTISALLLGTYSFTPEQVSSIESRGGVRIHHIRSDCPQHIRFFTFGGAENVLRSIREAGFLPAAPATAAPRPRGNPVRWPVVILALVIWNGLILGDLIRSGESHPFPGPLMVVALVFAFGLSVGTLKWQRLQRLVLRPDRDMGEITAFLKLIAFVTGIMFVVFSILLASGVLAARG